ncbi:MAG: 6-bladed beta-propeller [Verrucomicrobiota bacterium]
MRAAILFLLPTLALAHPEDGTAPGKAPDTAVRTGNGIWTYEAVPNWGQLPDGKKVGPTHGGVVVDNKTGLIYASTDAEHAILVYQPDGKLVKSIAPECRGFHAMDIAEENGKTVLYGAQLGGPKPLRVVKLDTEGKQLLEISQATMGEIQGGWKGLTSVAVAPDGSIFCSMGYGAQFIHKFDATGKLIKSFGGAGSGEKVATKASHGLKVDMRYGKPRLLVCDRENRRLFHTDLDGNWIGVYATHLRRPCSVSIHGDVCAVAELEARVTILDKNGTPLSFLGDNPDKKKWANFKVAPKDMKPNLFTAPHGLSFDKDGNLYVEDWNQSGRVTKLVKVH